MRHKEPPAAMNHNAASDGIGWEPESCVWTRRNLKTTLPLNPARTGKAQSIYQFRCNPKLLRPVAKLIILMDIDPIAISIVAFCFIVRHTSTSTFKILTDFTFEAAIETQGSVPRYGVPLNVISVDRAPSRQLRLRGTIIIATTISSSIGPEPSTVMPA